MGNKFSCCKSQTQNLCKSNRHKDNSQLNLNSSDLKFDETVLSLQHISERETAETYYDPSTDATAGPLFVQRSIMNYTLHSDPNRNHKLIKFHKSSSCSTIYLDDSSISHPNLKNMIKCVSMAIYFHIYFRSSENILDIFDERCYPLENASISGNGHGDPQLFPQPDFRTIYRFIRTLFNAAQLSSECAIITLVYLERLLIYADIDIVPCAWRRIVLGAILLASKVWDDQAVWNVDYCQILKDSSIDDMNELERRFLEMIQFNINVPSSVYAKYYFELRELAKKNDLIFPSAELLTETRAFKLEAITRINDKNFVNLKKNLKKYSSFNSIPFQRKSPALIS